MQTHVQKFSYTWVDGRALVEVDHRQIPNIHLEFTRWAPSVVREARGHFGKLKAAMRRRGYSKMIACMKETEVKLHKLPRIFGMREVARQDGLVFFLTET
ncbi:MAG: hypothetical protein JW384_01333 [Nitrosomonadaceae bacterium]|nr:hypothetical protein [Nitrosomonadaceae bacterium]